MIRPEKLDSDMNFNQIRYNCLPKYAMSITLCQPRMVSNGLQMDKKASAGTFSFHLQTVSGSGSAWPGTVSDVSGRAALDRPQLHTLRHTPAPGYWHYDLF
jgi:hypothetical protein